MQVVSKPIEDANELSRYADRLQGSSAVGIDTEFTRIRTYLPQLELVQFVIEDLIFCVDVRQCGTLSPISEAIRSFSGTVVIHSAYQDIEVLHNWDALPASIFDTQIAAEFCGYGSLSYANLCTMALGSAGGDFKNLEHSVKYSTWHKRPFTDMQISYALDDVRYLLPLFEHLTQRLDRRGYRQWLQEDCEQLIGKYIASLDQDSIWKQFSRGATLPLADQYQLRELLLWREHRAKVTDRPRQWIIKDNEMVSIVENKPATQRALAILIGVRYDGPRKWLREVLEIVHRRIDVSSKKPLWRETQKLTDDQKQMVKRIQQQVNRVADSANLPPQLLLSSRNCRAMVRGKTKDSKLSGWRGQLLNDVLKSVCANS